MKLIISIFILDVYFIISLTPNETWTLIVNDFSEGKLLNEAKEYFIFQEDNYTQLDINDNMMIDIYKKQKEIFSLCKIRNYIFAINNTSGINITIFRTDMREYMKSWGIDVNNSVFTVPIIDQNDAFIYTGSKIKENYIPNSKALTIKQTLLNNMKNKEYYTAWNTLIKDIQDICFIKHISPTTTTTTPTSKPTNTGTISLGHHSNSNKGEKLGAIFGSIGCVLATVGGIIAYLKYGSCKNCNSINKNTSNRSDYNYNNNYDTYSNRYSNNNYSVGGNSVGGYSVGGYSVGGYSVGNNPVGGHSIANNDNDGCSGGA